MAGIGFRTEAMSTVTNNSDQPIYKLSSAIPSEGVTFDPDAIVIQGIYQDELSAHRAKRLWAEALLTNFLLDEGEDFSLSITALRESGCFYLACYFLTASGRYAFWRITNHQAPEAQYVIETAHIPHCQSRHDDILRAPDLRCVHDEPRYQKLYRDFQISTGATASIIAALKGIVKALTK